MNFDPLPMALYGKYSIIDDGFSQERVDEAKRFIKETILSYKDKTFLTGCSCGKDSTLVLQLVYEVFTDLGIPLSKLNVIHERTRYERESADKWNRFYLDLLSKAGVNIKVLETPLHADYAVRTLGVGVLSYAINGHRKCTEQKTSIVEENPEQENTITFSGTRGEESAKRAADKRIRRNKALGSLCASPLLYIREEDVWGYLKKIGSTFFGLSFEELKEYYNNNGRSRDGCWTCYAGTFGEGSDARRECRTRLQWLRKDSLEAIDFLNYPFQTLPVNSCAGPRATRFFFYEMWNGRVTIPACGLRPIAYCIASLEVVKDIERRHHEELVTPRCKAFIDDIHRFRYVYQLNKLKRWQMNKETWCGLNLMDNFCKITIDEVGRFPGNQRVLKYADGNWFKRMAIEYERRHMLKALPLTKEFYYSQDIIKDRTLIGTLRSQLVHSGWQKDMNKEPFPGLFDAAEAMGINCHPDFEETEYYKIATNLDYRKEKEEQFRKLQCDCAELVLKSHEEHPELFKEPDGLFCGSNLKKFLGE